MPQDTHRDVTGERFGPLVVEGFSHRGDDGAKYWNCRCDCGATLVVRRGKLTRNDHAHARCGAKATPASAGHCDYEAWLRAIIARPQSEVVRAAFLDWYQERHPRQCEGTFWHSFSHGPGRWVIESQPVPARAEEEFAVLYERRPRMTWLKWSRADGASGLGLCDGDVLPTCSTCGRSDWRNGEHFAVGDGWVCLSCECDKIDRRLAVMWMAELAADGPTTYEPLTPRTTEAK